MSTATQLRTTQKGEKKGQFVHKVQTGSLHFSMFRDKTSPSIPFIEVEYNQLEPDLLLRLKKLNDTYRAEHRKYSRYLTEPVVINLAEVFTLFATLPFSNSAVELVPDNILKITLVLPENLMLMVSMPTNELEQSPVFSVFEGDEALILNQGPLEKIIEGTHRVMQGD